MIRPWIEDNAVLAQLLTQSGPSTPLRRVEGIAFQCAHGDEKFFKKGVRIRFYSRPLPIPPTAGAAQQGPDNKKGAAEAAPFVLGLKSLAPPPDHIPEQQACKTAE